MDDNCQLVVFSDKAYNAIIRETFEWDPVETGGILLGHVLDNGCWIVMEVLPPGYGEGREGDNVFHESAYFEYNQKFVNYLAKSVAEQYEIPLELLGLWHRHPGSMDHFSGTDDRTNLTFAAQNPHGVISGLVNVDPQLRITMYYLSHNNRPNRFYGKPNYRRVGVEVGSDIIPEEYFKLRYYRGEDADLHPFAPQRPKRNNDLSSDDNVVTGTPLEVNSSNENIDTKAIVQEQINRNSQGESSNNQNINESQKPLSAISDITESLKKNKKSIVLILAFVAFICSLFSIKNDVTNALDFFDHKKKPLIEDSFHKQKANYDEDSLRMGEENNERVLKEEDKKDLTDKDNALPNDENEKSRSLTQESDKKSDTK